MEEEELVANITAATKSLSKNYYSAVNNKNRVARRLRPKKRKIKRI